jgi:acetyl-CoA carboxylase biotin carboxylase subunit
MFKKILIANRGEIALRIIRACHELGIKVVAVYSTADEHSLHVKFADEAVCIGPGPSSESYLNVPRIIAAGEITNADAIHPGYGFLAEDANFSHVCSQNNFTFIGPSAEIINSMGNKSQAKTTMKTAGIPVIPGSNDIIANSTEAKNIASKIGLPVMFKASAGGGGKGMRFVSSIDEAENAFKTAQSEAQAAFGNGDIYVEKFIENPRHIELQILADRHGNAVHLGERECSVQRRHQKLVEESPSVAVDKRLRKKLGQAAVTAVKSVGYIGVGKLQKW